MTRAIILLVFFHTCYFFHKSTIQVFFILGFIIYLQLWERKRLKKNYTTWWGLKSRFRKTFFPSLNSMQCNISIIGYLLKFSVPFCSYHSFSPNIFLKPTSYVAWYIKCLIFSLSAKWYLTILAFTHTSSVRNIMLELVISFLLITVLVCLHIYIYTFPTIF